MLINTYFVSGGLWNIDKAATDEMTDVGTRIYSSCVLNEDKGTFHFSDFPQSKVIFFLKLTHNR